MKKLTKAPKSSVPAGTKLPESAAPVMMVAHTRVHVFINGAERDIRVGDRVSSDDPIVTANAWGFIEESAGSEAARRAAQAFVMEGVVRAQQGADETERQLKAAEERYKERFKPIMPPPIPLEQQMLCIKSAGMIGYAGGQLLGGERLRGLKKGENEPLRVARGEIADRRWVICREYPESFVKVLPVGVAVEDALVCVSDEPIRRFDANGERICYPGQLVRKDDELVALNPTMFAPVGTPWNARRMVITIASGDQVVSDTGHAAPRIGNAYVGGD